MTNEETRLLAELTQQVRSLNKHIETLTEKMEKFQEHRANELSRMAVTEEKVGRLEKIVYGLIGLVFAQAIALIFQFIK